MKRIALCVFLFLCLSDFGWCNPEQLLEKKVYNIVNQASQGKAKVAAWHEYDDVIGVVLEGVNSNGKNIIGWIPKSTDMLILGNAIQKGKSLNPNLKKATKKDIQKSKNKQTFDIPKNNIKAIQKSFSIDQFKISNPKATFYVFFDPVCKFCERAYYNTKQKRAKYIKSKTQIKWIPIAILDKKSEILASSMLALNNMEKYFHIANRNRKNQIRQKIENITADHFQRVDKNTILFFKVLGDKLGTPLIVWEEDNVLKKHIGSDINGLAFD